MNIDARAEAIATLEELQRNVWRDHEPTEEKLKSVKEYIEQVKAALGWDDQAEKEYELELLEKKKKLFSKFEPVEIFLVLSNLVEKIETVVDTFKNIKNKKKILFGSLSTGDVNGVAIDFRNPEYSIVLIDDGVLGFANLLSKSIAHAFPMKSNAEGLQFSTDIELVKERIAGSSDLSFRLTDLILAYIISGNPHHARPYPPQKEYAGLSSVWRESMELFILGHEYGHVRLGHLDSQLKAMIHHDGYDEIPASWQQEFEADHFGLIVTLACLAKNGISPSLGYAGIEAFFFGLGLLEQTLSQFFEVEFVDEGSSTHPPASLRREMLRRGLADYLEESERDAAIELARVFEAVLGLMAPTLRDIAAEVIKGGAKPHEKWH
jgi:hypothetical protein